MAAKRKVMSLLANISKSIVVKNENYSDINSPENTVGNISKKLNTIAGEGGWEVGGGSCWYCRDKITSVSSIC